MQTKIQKWGSSLAVDQAGRRPALVLSPKEYNGKVGLALCCPVTSRARGYPFEVALPDSLEIRGVILCDQIKSLDWRVRRAERITSVPDGVMHDVTGRVLALVDPDAS